MLSELDLREIRSQFPIFERKIYLNSCSQGALSRAVQAGFDEYLSSWNEQGSPWDLWVTKYEAARVAFAQFVNASPDEIAILTSASAGMNVIASALNFKERKKVVMGEFEFPTMGHVWLAQRPRGAEVLFAAASGNEIPQSNYQDLIDRETAIVPLTHVCFKNGFRSDVAAIVSAAHAAGAFVMLDDYQDCGTRPVDVKALDLDFYISGTLKYLLGPPGLAFMYVRKELIPTLVPTITGWFAQLNPFAFDPTTIDLSPTARRFESGSPSVPNVYGAIAGIDLLQRIGLQHVADHIHSLTQAFLRRVRELGIKVKTPQDSAGPLVVLEAKDSDELVRRFAKRDIVLSNRHDGLRISFHVYNSMTDVEMVLQVLEDNLELFALHAKPATVGGI